VVEVVSGLLMMIYLRIGPCMLSDGMVCFSKITTVSYELTATPRDIQLNVMRSVRVES